MIIKVCVLCVLLAACAKNGYLVRIESHRLAQFDQALMTSLEEEAIREGFVVVEHRAAGATPEMTVSSFVKRTAPDDQDPLRMTLVCEKTDIEAWRLMVQVDAQYHGANADRRIRIDDLASGFERTVKRALGSNRVTVQREVASFASF